MPRTFVLAIFPLLAALLSACGASTTAATAPQTCPEGFFWNGTECEKRRSIVIEEGSPKPPAPAPTGSAPLPPSAAP